MNRDSIDSIKRNIETYHNKLSAIVFDEKRGVEKPELEMALDRAESDLVGAIEQLEFVIKKLKKKGSVDET